MTTYAFRDERGDTVKLAPEFGRPIPVHALEPSSLAAVEAHRRYAANLALDKELAKLVTDHGVPKVEPYEKDVVTANAAKLAVTAHAAGFEVVTFAFRDACRVEGLHRERRVGFRATWTRGRADGAAWLEPWRYGLIEDRRPIGVNAKTRTGLARKRAAGIGTTRLTLLGSPYGLPITHATLNERIAS